MQSLTRLGSGGGAMTRIKCKRCGNVKNREAFSDNQLDKLASFLQRNTSANAAVAKVVPCRECSGELRIEVERKCCRCKKYKSRDAFNQTQFKKGEEAVCERCLYSNDDSDSDSHNESSDDGDTVGVGSGDDSEGFSGVSVSDIGGPATGSIYHDNATAFSGHDADSVATRSQAGSSVADTASYATSDAGSSVDYSPPRFVQRMRVPSPTWSSAASTTTASTASIAPHRRRQN